jgi:pimeloyl-ACP methyl ester carboxylesterase/DNA-binding CsgD family transcriptional regulator
MTVNLPGIQYAKTIDGASIAFLTVGNGPPIVFASNIFGDAHLYRHLPKHHVRGVTDRLAALGWKVIRYDVRGMGSSDRTVADLTLDARVNDLDAVVMQLGLDRFVLAGLDIGAATAIAFTTRNASRVSRLVLLSPWVSGAEMFALPDLRVASGIVAAGEREWNVFTNVLGNVASSFEDVELGKQMAAAMRQSTTPAGLAEFYKTSACIDLKGLLSEVAVPTLVIHEPAFPFGSLALCQEVAKNIRDARFIEVRDKSIAGTTHEGHVYAIDRFLRPGTAREPRDASSLAPHAPPTVTGSPLTSREIQVLTRVASGLTNKEIAAELGVAVPTVERHLVNLYTKIGARGRVDATGYALRHRLVGHDK